MSMDIHPYTKERIEDVVRFEQELRRQEDFYQWRIDEAYIRQVTASFDNAAFDAAVSFLAYENGAVVGRIDAAVVPTRFDGSSQAYLDWLCVLKSHRHRGGGRQLMQSLRTELKRRGVAKMVGLIAANDEAQRFYRAVENARIQDEGIWIDII